MPLDSSAGFLGYCGAGEMSPDPYLPFVDHVTPRAMLLRDGSVLGTARLAGAKFDLAAGRERNGHIVRLTAFLNAVADDNTEAFFHFVRHDGVPEHPRTLPPAGEYDRLFLEEWNRELAGRLRANDWFVSVLVRPRRTPIAAATRTVKRSPPMRFVRGLLRRDMAREDREQQEEDDADLDDRLGQLEDAFSLIDGLLRHADPRRLGLRTEDTGVSYSEIAEALELIRTTKGIRCRPGDAKMPLMHPPGTIGQMLAVNDPIAGRRGFEVRYGPGGTDSHFGQIYGLTTHPKTIALKQFDDLLSLDSRLVLTLHIKFMNRAQQQDHLKFMRRVMATGDADDEESEEQLRAAVRKVAHGEEVRAICRWSLAIHADPDPGDEDGFRSAKRKIDKTAAQAKTILTSAGFKVAPEGRGAKSALIAQTPGAPWKCQIRPATLPTDYAAMMASCGGFATGPDHFRWTAPVLRYPTTGGTAFDDDFFVGEGGSAVGHCVVAGPNGEGKSVWLGANLTAGRALLRAQRRPGTQILFDVGHSQEQTILANGGNYLTILAGEDSGVAPLRLPNTRPVRAMLRYLIAGLCKLPGEPLPAADVAGIRDGVDFVMNEMAPDERHLGVVRSFMGFEPNGAGARLEPWCRQFEGERAWAFDGIKHLIDFDVELAGVDLTAVKDNPDVMPPMGNTLLWLAAEMMDGRRMVVWCEEAPGYFNKQEFSAMGKAMALRARKQNACFVAIAQMPEHLLETEVGKALIKQARKFVLFRNTGAERTDYIDGLGVPEPVFEMVRKGMFQLPYHSALIFRRDGQSSVVRFDLSNLKHHLAVFSGTTNSVRLWREIAARHGGAGRATLEEFWRRLPEAAA